LTSQDQNDQRGPAKKRALGEKKGDTLQKGPVELDIFAAKQAWTLQKLAKGEQKAQKKE